MPRQFEEIRQGIYEHHKGGKYLVLGLATHSERPFEKMVLYMDMVSGRFWVKNRSIFFRKVRVNGKRVPNYKFIGEVEWIPREMKAAE